jgi:hypothetical protein
VPWSWEVAFRTACSWHGKGTAWAQHGNGMVCVNQPLSCRLIQEHSCHRRLMLLFLYFKRRVLWTVPFTFHEALACSTSRSDSRALQLPGHVTRDAVFLAGRISKFRSTVVPWSSGCIDGTIIVRNVGKRSPKNRFILLRIKVSRIYIIDRPVMNSASIVTVLSQQKVQTDVNVRLEFIKIWLWCKVLKCTRH